MDPIASRPPVFLTGANGIYITPRVPLLPDSAGPHAEPGGGTILLQQGPASISHNQPQGEGIGNLPPSGIPITDNAPSFDKGTVQEVERRSRTPPKPERGCFCALCPDLPSFAGKASLKRHRRQHHGRQPYDPSVPQCPMCPARIPKQPLAKHLKKVHGITDAVVKGGSPTVSASTVAHTNDTGESLRTSQDVDDAAVSRTGETISGRVYCQEYDCGRGFSSKAHLESHMRFFHSKQPEQIVEVQKAVDQSVEQPLEHHPPTLTAIPPHLGGRAAQDDRGLRPPVGTRVPAISVGGYQGVNSLEESTRTQIGIHAGSSTQGGVNAQPKRESPTTNILPLHCRVCKAPPTVTTQPTATTCGHLFCSECITQHVASTSRCPVCNSSLLLYCLFKLDLSMTS